MYSTINECLKSVRTDEDYKKSIINTLEQYFPYAVNHSRINGTFLIIKLYENLNYQVVVYIQNSLWRDIDKNLILLGTMTSKQIELISKISGSENLFSIPELITDVYNLYDENVEKILNFIEYFNKNSDFFEKRDFDGYKTYYNPTTGFAYTFKIDNKKTLDIIIENYLTMNLTFYLKDNNDEIKEKLIYFEVLKDYTDRIMTLCRLKG